MITFTLGYIIKENITKSDSLDSLEEDSFIVPLKEYTLNGDYGMRIHPITRKEAMHYGADLGAEAGAKVYACKEGEVITARWHDSYGNYIVIDHGENIRTLYAHNSKLLVKEGDYVEKGQEIAEVGMTGDAEANHVHLEVYVDGKNVYPRDYIPY